MVITSSTRNRVALTGTWVQIPPSPPSKAVGFAYCFLLYKLQVGLFVKLRLLLDIVILFRQKKVQKGLFGDCINPCYNGEFRDLLEMLLQQYKEGLKVVRTSNELRFGCAYLTAVLNYRAGNYKSITKEISKTLSISLTSAYAYKNQVIETINDALQDGGYLSVAF